ncbi:hypothetical protein quinque_011369 [Culex quinquefasciatus]
MDCTDIVIEAAHWKTHRVWDYYIRDRSTPRVDAFWGGKSDLTETGGFEGEGTTTIVFRRKLAAIEPTNHSIVNDLVHQRVLLVYVRESTIHEVLEDVKSIDISDEQSRIQQCRRTECTEATKCMNINVLLEDYMEIFQKSDLFDPATATYRTLKQVQLPRSEELVDDLSGDGLAGDEPAEAYREGQRRVNHEELLHLTALLISVTSYNRIFVSGS